MAIVIIYLILGYWAAGVVLFHNKVLFGSFMGIFSLKLGCGLFFGWILIPLALIMKLLGVR